MFGDTPPVIVAVDAALQAADGFVAAVEAQLARHPLRLVVPDAGALGRRLSEAGLRVGPGLGVVEGGLGAAVAAAQEHGANLVRIWVPNADAQEIPLAVRVAAHGAGIRFRFEAPLESP